MSLPIAWAPDSLTIPEAVELRAEPYYGLGYHRLGVFQTDLPALSSYYPPIWHPITGDSVRIELTPSATAEPYQRFIYMGVSSGGLVEAEMRYVAGRRSDLVGTATGNRVQCQ